MVQTVEGDVVLHCVLKPTGQSKIGNLCPDEELKWIFTERTADEEIRRKEGIA